MKILMVCLGNICRSPLAEGILKAKLPSSFIVDSCGTISMHEGKTPDPRSVAVAFNHQVDISKQRSRPFSYSDFEKYDRIYCMDMNNFNDIAALAKTKSDHSKIFPPLKDKMEVPDPYWGTAKDFENVYHIIENACEHIATELKEKSF